MIGFVLSFKVLNDTSTSLTCEVLSSTFVRWYMTRESKVISQSCCTRCFVCRGLVTCNPVFMGTWSYLVVKLLDPACQSDHLSSRWYDCFVGRLVHRCFDQWCDVYMPMVTAMLRDAEAGHCSGDDRNSDICLFGLKHSVCDVLSICHASKVNVYCPSGGFFDEQFVSSDWIIFLGGPGAVENAPWFSGYSDAVGFRSEDSLSLWTECMSNSSVLQF